MVLAGAAWGVYSLRGRQAGDPLPATTSNFLWSVLPALVLLGLAADGGRLSAAGVRWAVLSGALASGVGYAVWYTVLPRLTAMRAATVQLTVPVLAALGGIGFLAETVSTRLLLSSALVLGGVGLAVGAVRQRAVCCCDRECSPRNSWRRGMNRDLLVPFPVAVRTGTADRLSCVVKSSGSTIPKAMVSLRNQASRTSLFITALSKATASRPCKRARMSSLR